jgi:hypothetical protein
LVITDIAGPRKRPSTYQIVAVCVGLSHGISAATNQPGSPGERGPTPKLHHGDRPIVDRKRLPLQYVYMIEDGIEHWQIGSVTVNAQTEPPKLTSVCH